LFRARFQDIGQLTTIVMETTQQVLSQFKTLYPKTYLSQK